VLRVKGGAPLGGMVEGRPGGPGNLPNGGAT